jgi:hypothetical protein
MDFARRGLLLLVAATALLIPGQGASQEDPQGTARIEISAGYETAYGNFCLPVANSGLGRQAADGGNLEWQLASNSSVVPVFVTISHRQSIAMTGHVEVVSSSPYYAEESPGLHTMTMSRNFIAPPGVPITVAMAPRVAPVATPGQAVALEVRIYREGMDRPIGTYQVQATQLEPAHVYSLLIDGASELGPPYASTVDISKYSSLPGFMLQDKSPPYAGMLSLNHYLLPISPASFTSLPLAARDFAFVCVNARAATLWTPEQQAALEAYALAGGYLCVYNTAGIEKLSTLTLQNSHQYGRGVVLICLGGLESARTLMDSWLRGEMEECTLWLYGSVHGQSFFPNGDEGRFATRDFNQPALDLREIYTGTDPTHSAGYLNPIWLYREACRPGAVEPWDYPEFNVPYRLSRPATLRPGRNPLVQNWNLAWVAQQVNGMAVKPLRDLSQARRTIGAPSYVMLASSCLILLLLLLAMFKPRATVVLSLGALIASLALLGGWLTVKPSPAKQTKLNLIDADISTGSCVRRSLTALPIRAPGRADLESLDNLRLIRSEQLGNISMLLSEAGPQTGANNSRTTIASRGTFLTAASDGICADDAHNTWPVRISKTRRGDETTIHVDTTSLKESYAVLFTPNGTVLVPAGLADFTTNFLTPRVSLLPGGDRLQAWREYYRRGSRQFGHFGEGNAFGPWSGVPDSFTVLRMVASDAAAFKAPNDLSRLGWSGLLQTVGGVRAFMGNQCWIYCELEHDQNSADFLRLTLSLDSVNE